ncbi:bifunctional precorrin-2 dehydrogenase/sirohydrochlorin ferrochelatase [Salegentibacter sp. BLCTC]|uniref:precorrin-2 dehydrogenase/sirohydrochlorin ferrochelatase family protein n=1 Tax=Salegentibacter sp. BLCTC TaxID=2697368 RepID=UPI00187B91D5|nr:bifunctional precorrin-2 dehydrogenase/sirohydrochlorin ferrochelatase [Salegentibacter sp. BLCTC]MBE7640983.1 bifunctional precorrin-2 dehydrogenase/sirohydrochlorin ferrochelatase [Salegentibacter sp. BLCTC]
MEERNELYPVFLKVNKLNVLVVGGGSVGHEKLHFLFKSSPRANVEVVATWFLPETEELAKKHGAKLTKGRYKKKYLKNRHFVIAATNDAKLNKRVHRHAKKRYLLANIADTPELCDFYMGGIVNKGHVKIAISTNGKSPTAAKRLRQFFEEVIPENINQMVENLNEYRSTIKGDFEAKVEQMNTITESLKVKNKSDD